MYQDLISIQGYNQGKDSELEGYTPAIGQPRRMVLLYILLPTIPPPPQVCVEVATLFFYFFIWSLRGYILTSSNPQPFFCPREFS